MDNLDNQSIAEYRHKAYMDEAIKLANYMLDNNMSMYKTAKHAKVSPSTVSNRLDYLGKHAKTEEEKSLYKQTQIKRAMRRVNKPNS